MTNGIIIAFALLLLMLPKAADAQTCGEPKAADFHKVTLVADGMSQPVDMGVATDGRVFIAEMQTGNIRLFQPGLLGTTVVGTVPGIFYVESDDGLVGLELDPAFDQNGWIYIDYSRKVNGVTNVFLSRVTFANGKIDMASEKVFFTFTRPDPKGHAGGGLAFDAAGNLYFATGDNTQHQASDGFGAFDITDSIFDDQRSSANTNDLRGKVLRIHPESNGTYTIPPGNLWEVLKPNLTATELPKVRKEIYAMGFRNPFRISVGWDGTLYVADVGPEAAADDPNRGSAGFDELDVATKAGFFGYPYCMGVNIGYNRIQNVTNGVITYGAPYDCSKPIDNLSPFNTGIKTLPAPVPATMWYQLGRKDFPEMGVGAESAIAGPVYKFDANLVSKVKFPPQYHGRLFFSDWVRGTHVTVTLANQSKVGKLTTFNVSDASMNKSDVAYQFGADGALYVLQYSESASRDSRSALHRIEYTGAIDPACAPVTVQSRAHLSGTKLGFFGLDLASLQLPAEAQGADVFDLDGRKIASFHRQPGEYGTVRLPMPAGHSHNLVQVRFY